MATAVELAYAEELGHLRENTLARGWELMEVGNMRFVIGLPARDGSRLWLLTECDDFPIMPPAWHWYNPETKAIDQPADTPRGRNYFHGSGRICAPWNRSAYRASDPKGPHGDGTLTNWATNPNTKGCTTLSAMALRLFVELQGEHYQGRIA